MEMTENNYEQIEVDMTSFVSNDAKSLRSKIKACQNQMDYLVYKYNLYLKKQKEFLSEYNKLIGVEEDGKPVQ